MTGFVSFVGSGPGDPDLLTLKAVNRLQNADAVLFDEWPNGIVPAPECKELDAVFLILENFFLEGRRLEQTPAWLFPGPRGDSQDGIFAFRSL